MNNLTDVKFDGFVANTTELKMTKTGKKVFTFNLAMNHSSKSDKEPKVSFLEVETWEKLAEMCSKKLQKGTRILVLGHIRQDRWEDENGKQKSKLKVISNDILFINSLFSEPISKSA